MILVMTTSLINSIIPAVFSLFLGPWSDKFGRKKVLIATFFGFSFTLLSFALVSFISTQVPFIDPRLYILAYIPLIVTGGWPSMIAVVLCYISDISSEKTRGSRMTIIEIIIFGGILLGTASCSFILSYTSPTTVFLIATFCGFIASLYVVLFVEETIEVDESIGAGQQIKELVSYTPVVEMIRACFKRRPFGERRIVWCLIGILMLSIFCMSGTDNVFYLFVREKFAWSLRDETIYNTTSLLVGMIGSLLGISLLNGCFNVSSISLAVLAILGVLLEALMKSVAQNNFQMYATLGVSLFKYLGAPMCRTIIASVIAKTEVGKIYSIITSFEAVSSLIASPLYTFIYEKTFKFFASAFFLITAGAYLVNLILIFCVARMKRTRDALVAPSYTAINDS